MSIADYSTSAASNLLLGTIPIGPGMEREKVNNAFQQLMADLAHFRDDLGTDDSIISLDPADVVSVTTTTALAGTAINRAVSITGSSSLTLSMPPVSSGNIGDCVFILVDNGYTGLATCTAQTGSGLSFGGESQRILRAGEMAFVMFDGTDWIKIMGVSKPFVGSIRNASTVAASYATNSTNWITIPCTDKITDSEPSSPWFSTDHILVPRKGWYRFELEVWFDSIVVVTPTYGHTPNNVTYAAQPLSGSESGASAHVGVATTWNVAATPSGFAEKRLSFGADFQSAAQESQFFMSGGEHVGPVFRIAGDKLTSVRVANLTSEIRTSLKMVEVAPW